MASTSPYRLAEEPAREKRALYWVVLGLGTTLGSACVVLTASALSLFVVCRIPSDVSARMTLSLVFAGVAALSLAAAPRASPFVWSGLGCAALVAMFLREAPWSTRTALVYGCLVPALLTGIGPPLARRGLKLSPVARLSALLAGWHAVLAVILTLLGVAGRIRFGHLIALLGLTGRAAPLAVCGAIGFLLLGTMHEGRRSKDASLRVILHTLWPALWRGAVGLLWVAALAVFIAGPTAFLSKMSGDGSQYGRLPAQLPTCGID